MSTCYQCKMSIPTGATICPFCRSDPRSEFEKEITQSAAEGLTFLVMKMLGNKIGNIIFQMIFFGAIVGFIAFFFEYGYFGLFCGAAFGYFNAARANKNRP